MSSVPDALKINPVSDVSKMSPTSGALKIRSASDALKVQDRRDQMFLTMAKDAAKVKEKSRVARGKMRRQVDYRGTRYRRFQQRRGEAMEEDDMTETRARHEKYTHSMAEWLQQQKLVNSEEGTPREGVVETENSGQSDDAVVVENECDPNPVKKTKLG
jgi:hypothetical protein